MKELEAKARERAEKICNSIRWSPHASSLDESELWDEQYNEAFNLITQALIEFAEEQESEAVARQAKIEVYEKFLHYFEGLKKDTSGWPKFIVNWCRDAIVNWCRDAIDGHENLLEKSAEQKSEKKTKEPLGERIIRRANDGYSTRLTCGPKDYPPYALTPWDDRLKWSEYIKTIANEIEAEDAI